MPSPSLASPFDLRRFPGVSASLSDIEADAALERATNAIVAECGWPLWQHTVTGMRVYDQAFVLPAAGSSVTAVSVTVNAVPLLTAEFGWQPNGIVDLLTPYYWSPTVPVVLVTYTAGFTAATMPGVIKDACVKLAADELAGTASNLKSDSWTVGGESETKTYDTAIGSYSLSNDRHLDAYRLTAAVA